MQRFSEGDRVRIDIPDESDPDHVHLHGKHGVIREVLSDDAYLETGDERDQLLYRIKLDGGESVDVRWRDLRPPLDGE